ncbi:MAG TPA: hypothetical protein V6D05_01795 [Stenomitos sp.]
MLPVLLAAATASTVASGSTLADRLVAEGFENVAMETRGERTIVWFEDRRSLDATVGLGQVVRLAVQAGVESKALELVPLHERLPVLGIVMPVAGLRAFLQGTVTDQAFGRELVFESLPPDPPQGAANSSIGRPELQLTPGYAFSDQLFGYANSTLRAQIAPGWHAQGRLQLQFYPTWSLAPTFGLVGGHRAVAPQVDAAWSMGRWSDERYGAEGELAGWLGKGEWLWRTRMSLVTTLVPSAVGSMEYRFPWADTYARVGAGFFPAGDRALFVTFGRLFSHSEIDAGYFRSDYGNQLRAMLITYLGPGRRPDPRPFRVEAPGWMEFDYRATAPQGATLLWPEPEAGVAWRRLTPDYVRRHLSDWKSP